MSGAWDHPCENPYEKAVPEDQLLMHDLVTTHPLYFGRLQLLQHTGAPGALLPLATRYPELAKQRAAFGALQASEAVPGR